MGGDVQEHSTHCLHSTAHSTSTIHMKKQPFEELKKNMEKCGSLTKLDS